MFPLSQIVLLYIISVTTFLASVILILLSLAYCLLMYSIPNPKIPKLYYICFVSAFSYNFYCEILSHNFHIFHFPFSFLYIKISTHIYFLTKSHLLPFQILLLLYLKTLLSLSRCQFSRIAHYSLYRISHKFSFV